GVHHVSFDHVGWAFRRVEDALMIVWTREDFDLDRNARLLRGNRAMRHVFGIACGIALMVTSLAQTANAQWGYPGGYGNYGWGGWGADPASGYMAGLGSYARGQGVYEVQDAKAQAINLDTMLKWNKALRARQQALRQEQQKEDEQRAEEREARVARRELEDGT